VRESKLATLFISREHNRWTAVKSFEELISEADAWKLEGWDFTSLNGRWVESPTPWDYRTMVLALLQRADSLLDMGTGGGEFLSSLHPLPKRTFATEGYLPNVSVARERLEPLGIAVIRTFSEDNSKTPQSGSVPFRADCFDLVINRHDAFVASEVYRVLKSSGIFLTQQVGSENLVELNELLGAERQVGSEWNLDVAIMQLEVAGFEVIDKRKATLSTYFKDIGAVICYLKAAPWQIPDFTVHRYIKELRRLDESMREKGGLKVKSTRFLVQAAKQRFRHSLRP